MGRRRSGFRVMMRLIGLVRPLSGHMVLAIILGLLGHVCATAVTVLGAYGVLNVLAGSGGVPSAAGAFPNAGMLTGASGIAPWGLALGVPLTAIVVGMGTAAILRGVLRYGEQACNHFIAFTLLAMVRERVFAALRHLAPAKLDRRDRGDLISLITSDIELLEVFFAHTISPVAIAVVFCALMVGFIGSMHPLLGLVAFSAYLLVDVAVPLIASRASGSAGLRQRDAAGALSGFVLDSLRGFDEIMQYAAGEARLEEMDALSVRLADEERRLKRVAGRNTATVNGVILVSDMAMLMVACVLRGQGSIGFEEALLAVFTLMGSFGPVVALANLGSTLQGTFAAGNRVLDILDEEPLTRDVTGHEEVAFSGALARHVGFAYDEREVLSDASLSVSPGEIVGVSGKSGSGKSTLLKLFMRFWDADHGGIEVSGRPIGDVNTDNLRALEALVEQDTQLFHDTIRNNVAIAKLDATDRQIEDACRKASIHDFICSLPDGYDTCLGELGDTLSGGERQRLGLARAFLHDAPFMLLDEPTSNLDSLNEGEILRALRRECSDKAVLLVSHRASTMRVADRVVCVRDGRVSKIPAAGALQRGATAKVAAQKECSR